MSEIKIVKKIAESKAQKLSELVLEQIQKNDLNVDVDALEYATNLIVKIMGLQQTDKVKEYLTMADTRLENGWDMVNLREELELKGIIAPGLVHQTALENFGISMYG